MTRPTTTTGNKLVIVDTPVKGDHRVMLSIKESSATACVININKRPAYFGFLSLPSTFYILFTNLTNGFFYFSKINALLGVQLHGRIFSGMGACLKWAIKSVESRIPIQLQTKKSIITTVHAHDLYCAAGVIYAGIPRTTHFIYDAHELEIHRNRKTGWLRVLIEASLERKVVQRANEIRVVNHAIAKIMANLYSVDIASFKVIYNDFYTFHKIRIASNNRIPQIIYIGMGVRNRQLEVLDAHNIKFNIRAYLLGSKLPNEISGHSWTFGPNRYELDLISQVKKFRCMMWCCLDAKSLSYQLATPNKFFQALAVGIPIIATEGTYLAEIVAQFEIGAIFNGNNIDEIYQQSLSTDFERWSSNVLIFRKSLRDGDILI